MQLLGGRLEQCPRVAARPHRRPRVAPAPPLKHDDVSRRGHACHAVPLARAVDGDVTTLEGQTARLASFRDLELTWVRMTCAAQAGRRCVCGMCMRRVYVVCDMCT